MDEVVTASSRKAEIYSIGIDFRFFDLSHCRM